MREHQTYTEEEIQSNINTLSNTLDDLLLRRKSINKDILNTKKQIKYWEELDESQYKMF